MAIVSNNTDATKTTSVHRNLVVRCVKYHRFTDVMREPEDNNAMLQVSREVHQFHKIISYYYAVGQLR